MVDLDVRAKAVLHEIEDSPLSPASRQHVLLNLALIYEDEDEQLARDYADKVIAIDRNSASALHAQAIVLEFEKDQHVRNQKLAAHEIKCRRRKAFVAANNIALSRAKSAKSAEEKRQILAPIMLVNREEKDHYNQTRAVIELSRLSLDDGRSLGDRELSQLINAYHFLFNEKMANLFDRCHEALWREFSMTSDQNNLLSLFRHSSLYWRLRGSDDSEIKYLKKTIKIAQQIPANTNNREFAYLMSRASAKGLSMISAPNRKLALTATD